MGDAIPEIQRHIERLRELALLPRDVAPAIAETLHEALNRQIAAGKGPDGKTWAPRKADGGRPLEDAAQALAVVSVGTYVLARLKGPEARHHLGRAKGGTVRQILPTKSLPAPLVQAFEAVIGEQFARTMETK